MISSADINRLRQDPSNVDETSFHLPVQITPPPILSHSARTLCGWLDNQLCSLVSGWVWPMGAVTAQREKREWDWGIYPLASSPREEGCIPPQGRMHPSQGSLPDETQSSQVPVLTPFADPIGPRGGNRSAVTSPGGTAPSLLLSLHCTNTISMYLTLSDYPVWGCYLLFCRDSDSPLRTYSPFYLLQILLSFLPFKNITTESCKCFPEREAHGDESKMRKTEQKWNLGTRGWSQMQPQCATVIKICRQRIRTRP